MSEHPSPIVVGIDFSEPARRALEVACALCEETRAPLVLLHVWNASHLAGPGTLLPQLESWMSEQKARLIPQLEEWTHDAKAMGIEVTARVIEGVASRVIPLESRTLRAGLVVVGRRGSANLSHVLLGSVSERVVHQSSCPVLVVPARLKVESPPRRLLVGVDFSEAAKDAFHVAYRFADQLNASRGLLLVHVQPREHAHYLQSGVELAYRREYSIDRDAFERWAKPLAERDVRLDFRVLEGDTEELVLRTAKQKDCDWVVLGLQGRTAIAAFLVGSTTDRILKLADRPVLVVPMTSDSVGEPTS